MKKNNDNDNYNLSAESDGNIIDNKGFFEQSKQDRYLDSLGESPSKHRLNLKLYILYIMTFFLIIISLGQVVGAFSKGSPSNYIQKQNGLIEKIR